MESVMKVTMMGKESTMIYYMVQGGGDIGGVSRLDKDTMVVVPKISNQWDVVWVGKSATASYH
jgi:hypothetical protein